MKMREPFKKRLSEIPREEAHGGSGARQLILSDIDPVSSQFQAMTKGYLAPNGIFDWHSHEGVDEFFLVIKGTGIIRFQSGAEMSYKPDELIYIPADQVHQIENTGSEENQFFFVRLNA
jgi:mannose-6-phosphate isomerase-like protein (cupin superfamily)